MLRECLCVVCGSTFTASRSHATLCSSVCKRTRKRDYDAELYQRTRQERIRQVQDWYVENREHKQAYDAAYRERTRERRLQLKREYHHKIYKKRPEFKARAIESFHRRRARKVAQGVFDVSERDRRRLLHRYANRCAYCGVGGVRLELDHVIPIARGGRHSIGNLLPACGSCNRSKNHRFVTEWRVGKVVPRQKGSWNDVELF